MGVWRPCFLLLLFAGTAILLVLSISDEALADPTPVVTPPTGSGPHTMAWITDTIWTSTKSYPTDVRIWYPATQAGENKTPDRSQMPYPTVIWLPGFGGDMNGYSGEIGHLVSWGFIVMSVNVNWTDFPYSANADDTEEFLDHLETLNGTEGSRLHMLVDKEAFGIAGHSSGGGLSILNGALVDRIKAVHPLAAAIGDSAINSLGPMYDRPILLHVGREDVSYIGGSRKMYAAVGAPASLVEVVGAGHGGPFGLHIFASFFLVHLANKTEYSTFLYGFDAVGDAAAGRVVLKFKLSEDVFFPPVIESVTISTTSTPMDEEVTFNATIRGYQRVNDPLLVHEWDVDGDGIPEVEERDTPNVTYAFADSGVYNVFYVYHLGLVWVTSSSVRITVTNAPPIAEAGPDLMVDQDSMLELNASGSFDTRSDTPRLEYRWDFPDGTFINFGGEVATWRTFTQVGIHVVTLTVRDPHGSEAEDTVNVTVLNVDPVAEAGGDQETTEDSSVYLAGYGSDTPSDADSLRFSWDFGDGGSTDWTSGPTATHTYLLSDTYFVTLNVKDIDGAVASDDLVVTVRNVPPSGEIVTPEADGTFTKDSPVTFRCMGNDTLSDIDLLEYLWDFGDGTTTDWAGWSGSEASHVYTRGGEFVTTLSIVDDDGTEAQYKVAILVVNTPPTAIVVKPALNLTVAEDAVVIFEGRGMDTPSDDGALTYGWTVDGVLHEELRVELAFPTSGIFLATFTVTDPEDATAEVSVMVTVVNLAPVVDATVEPLTMRVNTTVLFSVEVTDTPSDTEGLVVAWDFGDGGTSSKVNGTHQYVDAGNYTVTLTVTDDDGEAVQRTFRITVEAEPAEPPLPPNDDGTVDDGDTSYMLYVALGALGFIGVLVVLILLFQRRGKGTGYDRTPDPKTEDVLADNMRDGHGPD